MPPTRFGRLLRYLRPYTWVFLLGIVCIAVAAALDGFSLVLIVPLLQTLFGAEPATGEVGRNVAERIVYGLVGDFISPGSATAALRRILLLATAAILLKNLFAYLGQLAAVVVEERVERDVRDGIYGHLQRLPLGYFDREKSGQIIARVLTDTRQAKLLIRELADALRHVATTLILVFILFATSWRLTLVTLVLAPILTVVFRPILSRLRHRYRSAFDRQGEMVSVLQETVAGIRLVKGYGAERYERARFEERSAEYAGGMIHAESIARLASPLSEVVGVAVALAITWVGANMVLGAGTLGADQFILFVTVSMRLTSPVKRLAQFPANAQRTLAAADRFFEILDRPPEPALHAGRALAGFATGIRFERVSFEYESERPVLRDIDLFVPKGEIVALVGPSGAGKSTLVDLLPRFIEPTRGRITIDGHQLGDLSLDSVRRLLGIVSQETVIFNDTVRANIAYGVPMRWSLDEIRDAAQAAHADEFIRDLPLGYDTPLGDRGLRLSGGQRQRIGIARAILRDPPILIFDEATSNLDAQSERLIQDALDVLFVRRTVFVIAHRLSTVQNADRILVLDEGRIIDAGTHGELWARGGLYSRLADLQFGLVRSTVDA